MLLRTGCNLTESGSEIGGLDPSLHRDEHLSLRGRNDGSRQSSDAVLPRGGWKVIGIDFDRHVVGRDLAGHRGLSQNVRFHAFADWRTTGPRSGSTRGGQFGQLVAGHCRAWAPNESAFLQYPTVGRDKTAANSPIEHIIFCILPNLTREL